MNKKELSAKWSKYCDTDKLVDDMMALLKEYRYTHQTEHGICTLLDTYFEQKEPLIKLFITSKHYIGDMRIAVEKEFERQLNLNDIYYFFSNARDKFHAEGIYKFEDDDGKTIFDYLITGKTVFGIDKLPSASEQTEKKAKMGRFNHQNMATIASNTDFNDFMHYMNLFSRIYTPTIPMDHTCSQARGTPVLKKGTKTSRAFNKVCAHYGVDKFEGYNKVFAQYADLVSNLTRKMQFIISLNPLDYLTMSNGVNWHSCHSLSGAGGRTLSYMLDTTSMITFVVTEIDGAIHKIPKVYRQMYHYENNLFIQNRLYPQGNDGATNLYEKFRGFMIEEFTDLLGTEGEWDVQCGPEVCRSHIYTNGAHYPDYNYNRSVSIFYPENNGPSVRKHIMTIGHAGICLKCGGNSGNTTSLFHAYSSDCIR